MNHNIKLTRALPVLAAAVLLFTGCAKPIEEAYTFPEDGLLSVAADSNGVMLKGFASDLCVPEEDADLNTEGVDANAYALFSLEDGSVLSQHNIYEKVYPASTTKILTCLIALERGNLDDIVTVPDESNITVSGSSMADLTPGDTLTLRDLLYGLMVPSGNDAAVAIACHISGDVESFAQLMNLEARKLGATHSNFVNPHGLPDEDHYTTVYDMYLIFNEALKNEEFRKISSTAEYTCTINTAEGSENPVRDVTWSSGNGFLNGSFSFAEGMDILAGKTGHTSAAGFCLVLGESAADGKEYISIVFNAPYYEQLYVSMRNLASKSQ